MDDNTAKALHMLKMAETEGWKILDGWMSSKIESAKDRLLTVEPDDVKKIVAYQEQIKTYKMIRGQVAFYINKITSKSGG